MIVKGKANMRVRAPAGAHEGIVTFGAFFTSGPQAYGKYSRSADEVQTASKFHDPSMRTVHCPRNRTNGGRFRIKRSSTRNWIGDLHHTRREGRL